MMYAKSCVTILTSYWRMTPAMSHSTMPGHSKPFVRSTSPAPFSSIILTYEFSAMSIPSSVVDTSPHQSNLIMALKLWTTPRATIRSPIALKVLTWWQVPEDSMLHEFNISLQILTAELQNVRQLDRHLYDDLLPWNTIELSTVGLPKGTYKVVLILYNRMTGEKANRKDGAASIVPVLTVAIND